MDLKNLRKRVRFYVRDTNSKRFNDDEIDFYINEGIDRTRSHMAFTDMPNLFDETDEVNYIPENYHYILALFAASRCFGVDNDFYQEQDKRNEFENAFAELITKIENNEIYIKELEYTSDYVKDEYFDRSNADEDTLIE